MTPKETMQMRMILSTDIAKCMCARRKFDPEDTEDVANVIVSAIAITDALIDDARRKYNVDRAALISDYAKMADKGTWDETEDDKTEKKG